MRDSIRHFLAEFIGTFGLVFITGAARIAAEMRGSATIVLESALAYGLTLGVLITAMIRVGGHFNPAITLGFLAARRIDPVMSGVFIIAQFMGAAVAAWSLLAVFPDGPALAARLGGQVVSLDIGTSAAIALEAIGTFFLCFVLFGSAVDPRAPRVGGMTTGFAAGAIYLALGSVTGGSLNPARSFGPAAVSGVLEGQVVYWTGPIIGAIVAALLYDQLFIRRGTDSALHGAVQPTRDV